MEVEDLKCTYRYPFRWYIRKASVNIKHIACKRGQNINRNTKSASYKNF